MSSNTKAATPEQIDAFASMKWAQPYLTSPEWIARERWRGGDPDTDIFCKSTMRANNGVTQWLELYLKTPPGEKIKKTASFMKFDQGLNGFPGICHGGATMAFMDEGLAYAMVVNEFLDTADNGGVARKHVEMWDAIKKGKPLIEVLKGMFVTAKLEIQFLGPVVVPGMVGIETEILELKEHKMTIRGVMKDAKGRPVMQADGIWVKIGGAAKL
ncbi:hypothetical protein IQ06DRAFT_295591 [Phaeosphaeriaceae sp. SRC1lsM3a]|nr:hypothetical protein IQ06DRAFT_295591 [Stagonospora sp. SRC1lsM3a]